jgi:hypothetical protein
MPKQKDLKRLVRARMRKTGESYTTARAHLLARHTDTAPAVAPAARAVPAPAPEPDFAKLAGMSDAAVAKATGCRWAKWVKALDHHGAATMSHAAIAQLVHEKYHMPGWWSQTVTVGYERIRGLREKGQRRGGGYAVNKSCTFAVPVERLYAAFTATRLKHWLDGAKPTLRTSQPSKSVRMKWEDGTTVAIGFTRKGEAKSQVALGHEGFATKGQAERMRAWWTERFAALGEEVGAG